MKNWFKALLVLSVLSIAAIVWLPLPKTDSSESDKPTLICQWAFSDSQSGISVVEDPPPEMSVEELLQSGVAFSIENRRVLQCQPAGFSPTPEPSQRSSGTYVLND